MGKQQGFGCLPCPKCGADAQIKWDLDDLSTFSCRECEDEFTREEVETFIARWQRVLSWIDSAPSQES